MKSCSIFSQLLQLFPRLEFEQAVREHRAERHSRGFASWTQFISMLFCQLGRAHSLREICGGLASCEGKLRHLGVQQPPKRSTLAYANQHRPWQLYQTVFGQLLGKCRATLWQKGMGSKFQFRNKLMSLDSTVVDLSLSLYDWARFRRAKGAVKLHLLLDHDGCLPAFAVVTDGKTGDVEAARRMRFEAGTMLVFDRGYNDYEWFAELSRQRVRFVTRLKSHAVYEEVERLSVDPNGDVLSDAIVYFPRLAEEKDECFFRVVQFYDRREGKMLWFLTNHLQLPPEDVAEVYRQRWKIELFFKALKQNLKIKTFLGTSRNAVMTQIWTALIAMLLLRYLQLLSTFGWSLSNLAALLRHQLFVYRDLLTWLNCPFQGPPALQRVDSRQLNLGFGA